MPKNQESMLPPQIVLLLGKDGDTVQEIRRSLSTSYQVVVFEKLEKEIAWFKPLAVVIHQNGSPRQEVLHRLVRLRQFQPKAPVLICSSSPEYGHWPQRPGGVEDCLSWPDGLAQLKAYLRRWEAPRTGFWLRFKQTLLNLKNRKKKRKEPELSLPLELPSGLAEPVQPVLEARLLGSCELKAHGNPLPWINSEVNRAMLAYILYHHPERMLRRKLIDGFWPDSSEDSARNCLNVAISSLRRYLKDNVADAPEVNFRENAYYFDFSQPVFTDVQEFLRLWTHAQAMERANRLDEALNAYRRANLLYKGEFMECISRDIIWVESVRSKLKEIHLSMLDRMSELLVERKLYPEAINACKRIIEIDDCIESAHRRLMHCYVHMHGRRMALRQYHHCCKTLEEKLGARPSRETQALLEEIQGNG